MGSPAVFHLLNDRATARRALQSQLLLRQTGKEVWRAPLHTHTPSHPRQVGEAWGKNLTVVIAGLTNTYASYVTTFEEYQAQRYEGGFTLFGPNTLDAYIQEFKSLAKDMVDGAPLNTEDQPRPPNLLSKQWSLVPPVVTDSVPWGMQEGAERWSL
uniref:Neutral/alkaline non-lysosomal ceramidase N-terminal domain-containing protein n=1 Tax=Auxenochlorella protothecoides TaxID=3075 RepID=A0A1D1ZYS6_AUXPR